jgi:isochorismate synthase
MNSAKSDQIHSKISTWESLWTKAQNELSAIAIWRLPNHTESHLIIDEKGGKEINSLSLNELGSGFMVAPFQGSPYFLNADQLIKGELSPNEISLQHQTKEIHRPEDQIIFIKSAKEAIQKIESGDFQKVVLSRISQSQFSNNFSIVQAFQQLCIAYPKAFVSAVHIPKLASTWLCASPEILVEKDQNGIFKTMALAGTQSAVNEQGLPLSVLQASWTHKEIEEQAFVSRYIIDCFKKIRLREYQENGPKTIIAGNLMHLKTEYLVDTQAIQFPALPGIMLSLLHPTSAVCGTPKESAIEWIKEAETHDRGMYSGYLGPVNIDQEIQLFVNLRTVRLEQKLDHLLATYFAGCGITEDSEVEKEWLETELKCATLKAIIEK